MKRTTVTILAAITMLAALSGSAKAAVLTFTLKEVGSNVVGTVSGTLNTSALTYYGNSSDSGCMLPSLGVLVVGPTASQYNKGWQGFSGSTTSFGSGAYNIVDAGSGDTVSFAFNATKRAYVSQSYVSGSALSGTATWSGNSFATLGITKGTYTMTYNGGVDSVVLQAGIVPEPATMSLLALGGIATLIRRRRRA
jgi:PEP-CTERM motif